MHSIEIKYLQEQIKQFYHKKLINEQLPPISLHYRSGHSNTTRSKTYKKSCYSLHCGALDHVVQIDAQKQIAIVEPRVTMDQLVKATLPYGLMPAIVPEFKGITVGGAILGGAAESSSHQWGAFNDACHAFEILRGDGTLIRASASENQDLYYGLPGSYGAFGFLTSAEIQLVPAKNSVHLHYHIFTNPMDALHKLQKMMRSANPPQFLDGIIFGQRLAVVIEGCFIDRAQHCTSPLSSKKFSQEWYYQHVRGICQASPSKGFEESMPLYDYLFRYDRGGFWMGAYLSSVRFLAKFFEEGVFKLKKPVHDGFTCSELQRFLRICDPKILWRMLLYPIATSQNLFKLLHKAEGWIQNRLIIQDFCIPEINADRFLEGVLANPGVFPIWLCPIKGTCHPQLFAPHFFPVKEAYIINFGIYGLPALSSIPDKQAYCSIEQITRRLEQMTAEFQGRKVLYSRSYYSQDEFWNIYPKQAYKDLRKKTYAEGVWQDITEKILSQ